MDLYETSGEIDARARISTMYRPGGGADGGAAARVCSCFEDAFTYGFDTSLPWVGSHNSILIYILPLEPGRTVIPRWRRDDLRPGPSQCEPKAAVQALDDHVGHGR